MGLCKVPLLRWNILADVHPDIFAILLNFLNGNSIWNTMIQSLICMQIHHHVFKWIQMISIFWHSMIHDDLLRRYILRFINSPLFRKKGPLNVFFSQFFRYPQKRATTTTTTTSPVASACSLPPATHYDLLNSSRKRPSVTITSMHARAPRHVKVHKLLTVWFRNPGNKLPVDMENLPSFREFLDMPGGVGCFSNKQLWTVNFVHPLWKLPWTL